MTYDKPKVTIDLDEYNELQQSKNQIKGDESLKLAKTIIAVVLNNINSRNRIGEELKNHGIYFAVNNIRTSSIVEPDNISMGLIKD